MCLGVLDGKTATKKCYYLVMTTLGYIEKKTPVLLTIASLVIIFPIAIRTFTVLMELLNSFQITALANFVIFLILTVAAFRLLAMKRWALYVITAAELVWILDALYSDGLNLLFDGLVIVGIVVAWLNFDRFES